MYPIPFPMFAPSPMFAPGPLFRSFLPTWNNIAPPLLPPKPKPKPASPPARPSSIPTPTPPDHDTIDHIHAVPHPQPPRFAAAGHAKKKVYINTFSRALVRHNEAEKKRVIDTREKGMKPLLTVEAMTWKAPPEEVCKRWSGISEEVQRFVKERREAKRAISLAITEILKYLDKPGNHVALIEVCCVAGTHRSVPAAELMGEELANMGVDVYVRHLHRKRMPRDEW